MKPVTFILLVLIACVFVGADPGCEGRLTTHGASDIKFPTSQVWLDASNNQFTITYQDDKTVKVLQFSGQSGFAKELITGDETPFRSFVMQMDAEAGSPMMFEMKKNDMSFEFILHLHSPTEIVPTKK